MEQGNIMRDFGMNYVSIPSDILQDVNISLKARGLYVTIMGLPRHWSLSIRGLLPILKESKNTICSILKELETYGYVSRSQSKDSSGKYGDIVYTLHARSAKLTDKTASEQEEEKQTQPCNASFFVIIIIKSVIPVANMVTIKNGFCGTFFLATSRTFSISTLSKSFT